MSKKSLNGFRNTETILTQRLPYFTSTNMIFNSMRRKLKAFSILFSLVLLLAPIRTSLFACDYYSDYEELRFMLFNPDLLENKAWWTFFYNNDVDFMDGSVFSDDDETLLAREWKEGLSLKASETDIKSGLFGSLPDSLIGSNGFYQEIQNMEPVREYFDIAHRAEALSGWASPWET